MHKFTACHERDSFLKWVEFVKQSGVCVCACVRVCARLSFTLSLSLLVFEHCRKLLTEHIRQDS